MPTVVDRLITEYIAVDKHTPIAERVARAMEQIGRASRTRVATASQLSQTIVRESRAEEALLRVAEKEERVRRESARALEAETKARTAAARAADIQAKAEERLARQRARPSFASQFARGFGSTRIDLGAASPLLSSFSRGPGGVAGALAGTAVGGGIMAASGLLGAGRSLLGGAAGAAMGGARGIGGALAAGWNYAGQAAMSYEARLARLAAVAGGTEAALRKLGVAQAVAAPSPFTTKQLSDSAVLLEAMGVNAERALPTIGKLGAAMGADDVQLEMFTRAIGELAQGNMIDKDVLSSMGLTQADFKAKGIKFDNNNALKSSAEETLMALESIVEERFGKVLDTMAQTAEAKRASFQDAGEQAGVAFGKGVLRSEGPIVESLTKILGAATSSGVLEEAGTRASDSVLANLGIDRAEQGMVSLTARVIAFAEVAPGNLVKGLNYVVDWVLAATNNVGQFFTMMENRILRADMTFKAMTADMSGYTVNAGNVFRAWEKGGIFGAGKALWDARQDVKNGQMVGDFIRGNTPGVFTPSYQVMPKAPQFDSVDPARVAAIQSRITANLNNPAPGMPDTSGIPFLTRSPQQALADIARNTRQTADNTNPQELRDLIFGGGDRARAGVSLIDALGGRSASRRLDFKIGRAASFMERALLELVRQNLPYLTESAASGRY